MYGERYFAQMSDTEIGVASEVIKGLAHLDYKETVELHEYVENHWSEPSRALLDANDRYYLLTRTLHRMDALHPWLFDRCREVEADPYGHLDLWAREHYKSTIITFAGCIQELIQNPEQTIGIFSGVKVVARPFLSQIKEELEGNEDLKRRHPDVFWADPKREAPTWSLDAGIVVKRQSNPKEASIEAHGLIDGLPTGRHFGRLYYDDIIDEKLVANPDMIKKATERWELSDNLGAGEVKKCHVGTRYSFADTYGVLLGRKVLKPRLYPATDDGTLTGKPVLISEARWEEKKRSQRSTVSAQMLQNPLAGQENTFEPGWFRGWDILPPILNIYIMVDPSKGRSATSDRTAIAVVGVDQHGVKYLVDGYRHRMTLSQRWLAVKGLWSKWMGIPGVQAVYVGWEQYGAQTDLEYVQEKMRHDRCSFDIKELNWVREGGNSKADRVERLEPDFRLERFYLPSRVYNADYGTECIWSIEEGSNEPITYRVAEGQTRQQKTMKALGSPWRASTPIKRRDEDGNIYDLTRALFEEMLFFPFSPKDDLVDAVSRIYDMEPLPPEVFEGFDMAPDHEGFYDA